MSSQSKLISVLWETYFPKIRSGLPVYFTFHREQLIRIFEAHSIPGDPARVVNTHASQWYDVDGDIAVVRPEAFMPQWNRFSAVILLIAQQVLVVEDMAKDRLGFSEDAYFPRLRRAISNQLQERSQHPFGTSDEFDEIWRKFRSEIMMAGGTARSVTFFSGKHSNRNRSYPLSQALLSQEDVIKLIRLIGEQRIFTLSLNDLKREVNSSKERLSKRGQKTLGIPFLEERVYEQIRAYKGIQIPEEEKNLIVGDNQFNCDIKIYRDQVDFGTEEFRIGFFDRAEGTRVTADANHRAEFRLLLNRRNFLIFSESTLGDSWVTSEQVREISYGESLVFVATKAGKAMLAAVLKRFYFDVSTITWQTIQQFDDLYLGFLDSVPTSPSLVRVKNGTILEQVDRSQVNRIVWMGGVCVSERENKFLLRFMPDKYTVGNTPSLMLGPVKVNGRLTTFETFKADLNRLDEDQKFEIETLSGQKGFLAVAVPKGNRTEKRGYQISEIGILGPSVSEMPLGTNSLQGFSCCPAREVTRLKASDLAILLSNPEVSWPQVSKEVIEWVITLVQSAPTSGELKSVLRTKLRKQMVLPLALIQSLEIEL